MKFYALDLAQLIKERDFQGITALLISKIPLLIGAVVILLIGIGVSKLAGKLTIRALVRKNVDPSVHRFIKTIIVFIVNTVFVLTALSTLGLNVNSFLAAIAAGGVAAGLGLQSSVSQFASGLQILVNHPFRSGDYIDIGSVSGIVKEITLMYTALVTLDNKRVIIPNSTITSSNLINYTAEKLRRIDLVYSVSYDADIGKAKQSLLEVARGNERIKENPAPIIAVCEHAASSINIACQVWCDPSDYWEVFYYMQESVKRKFDEDGISIPYSQLDVHLVSNAEG